jgi:hypothetical protein
MIREMSPIEVDEYDREVFLTAARCAIHDDLPENVHPGQWIANAMALGLLLWGLIWWVL